MNKQEILDEINKTKEHLADMEKMLLEVCEYERWKPKEGETYYSISEIGSIIKTREWLGTTTVTETRRDFYNIFQTREQAEQESEKILVRRMLEDIARRLNKGKKIDWNNYEQSKHCIELYCNNIVTNFYSAHKTQGTVYCLDKSFKDVTIREIGEERLKAYLRGE